MPHDTKTLLRDFAAAWNRHDIEGLLALVTEDCVFETAAGPTAQGSIFAGKAALRAAFPAAWQTWPDARWEDAVHVVAGSRAFSEWTFRGTDRAGSGVEVRGVDLFEIRDGLIARKDTYRKVRTG
ncbi:nuclear transport factor 2 family protein [Sediminicoccus rosea]|uniref:Nuclear transport factor 2 family protein n=1 Tax=Sediminicoccus rosea TaxID=1225128 RepID=A0ABZ0PDN5_9PROT|nr:nuclear transport factor 2 family protein [Sediminicoccus rosea]WPB83820.1 nuclear transport factor 2 family protein [Sediminicoccus rosea]